MTAVGDPDGGAGAAGSRNDETLADTKPDNWGEAAATDEEPITEVGDSFPSMATRRRG